MKTLHIEAGSVLQRHEQDRPLLPPEVHAMPEDAQTSATSATANAPAKPPRLRHAHMTDMADTHRTTNTTTATTTTTTQAKTIGEAAATQAANKSKQLSQLHSHAKKQLQFRSPLLDAGEGERRHSTSEQRRRRQRQRQKITNASKKITKTTVTTTSTAEDVDVCGRNVKVIAMPNIAKTSTSATTTTTTTTRMATQSATFGGTRTAAALKKGRLAQGCTSLMYACQQGDVVEVLAQMRAKPELIRQRDSRNKNALHYCAAAQNVQQTRDLVAAASIAIAAPELLESADEDGFTPLHLAVIQGNLAMVNLLLANKADVNAVDNEGHSVVHWATVCGEVEALRAVLAAGANVAKPDINGGSPLHYGAQMCGASYEGRANQSNPVKLALEILGILLAHPNCSVDVQDKDGRQPLLWAASAGSAKAIVALVKAGSRIESADKDGLTALHCAASRGHTECIDTLISLCGAPTDLIDSNGCTALHYAVTLGHADATARLLDLEADPNRQDRKGRTPAHCGCSKGQFETLKLLKERGANLWLRNAKGDLPMHEAASSGRRELVEWLLQQRPKQVNTTSNDGRSMLHIAAANDYTDVCKMLLDYGGDINALYRNSKGVVMTPLDCALQRGHRSTAKFLQSHDGLPSSKLRLAARRANPFHEATADMVRPLKYVEKEEIQDLRNSKKYVVYLKRSDSDGGNGDGGHADDDGDGDGNCSCTEQTYRKEQRYEHTCRRHKRRQLRRRTSSCGESKHTCRDKDCSDICRSKSNIEIRRRKSRERYVSSSDWDDDEEDEDSCENCCYHKRQKQRVVQRNRSTSVRRSKDSKESDEEGNGKSTAPALESHADPKEHDIEVVQEGQAGSTTRPTSKTSQSHPQSATKRKTPPTSAAKEATFIKSPPQSAQSDKVLKQTLPVIESHAIDLTDDELDASKAAEVVTTQVDVHRDAEQVVTTKSSEALTTAEQTTEATLPENGASAEVKPELSEEETQEVAKEVEQVIKIAATALSSESKSSSEEVAAELQKASAEPAAPQAEPITEPGKEVTEASEAKLSQTEAQETAADAEAAETEAAPATVDADQPSQPTTTEPGEATEEDLGKKEPGKAPGTAEPSKVTESAAADGKDSKPPEPAEAKIENGIETPKTQVEQKQQAKQQPKTPPSVSQQQQQQQQQLQQKTPPSATQAQQREQESRRSFTLLPSDSADEGTAGESSAAAVVAISPPEPERKSSFQVLKSDESVGELDDSPRAHDVEFSDSQVFQIVHDDSAASKLHSDVEISSPERGAVGKAQTDYEYEAYEDDDDDADADGGDGDAEPDVGSPLRRFMSSGNRQGVGTGAEDSAAIAGIYDVMSNGRKRRLKKRVRSGTKTRSNWKNAQDAREGTATGKDHDSGFEPSPRATKTKIPTPRNIYTAYMPRRSTYATLDGRSCSSRLENRKPGDKDACDMAAVTRSIQRNIRRYYMERKIFQHLLELKSLQIRSNKLNEAVLVKRAVDDYHKSCLSLGGETGTRLRRYNFSEYTFKNFELFLYETLKGLQKPGTYNFQNINEVYEEAERRLSPDYNAYEKALQCTTKTHRCLHAAHAYTGIPCAAYIPMMNHHTMPKFGFGSYKKSTVSSFYLPKILTSSCGGTGGMTGGTAGGAGGLSGISASGCGGKVALELSHGKSKQLISLPSEKLNSNKRYYVTFTVKESAAAAAAAAAADAQKLQQQQQQQQKEQHQNCGTASEACGK